jgi:hypothetical protein
MNGQKQLFVVEDDNPPNECVGRVVHENVRHFHTFFFVLGQYFDHNAQSSWLNLGYSYRMKIARNAGCVTNATDALSTGRNTRTKLMSGYSAAKAGMISCSLEILAFSRSIS